MDFRSNKKKVSSGGARAGSGPKPKEPDVTNIARQLNTIELDHELDVEDYVLDDMKICPHCGARLFSGELNKANGKKDRFGACCQHGTIKFPPKRPPPLAFQCLLGRPLSAADRKTPEGMKIVDALMEKWVLSGEIIPRAEDFCTPELKEVLDRYLSRHPEQPSGDSRAAEEEEEFFSDEEGAVGPGLAAEEEGEFYSDEEGAVGQGLD